MSAESDQHDPDGRLERTRQPLGDRMAENNGSAGEDEQRQRMTKPPCQPVFDNVADIGPAGRNAGNRRDVIGLERMLHSKQEAKPQNSEHVCPDFTLTTEN